MKSEIEIYAYLYIHASEVEISNQLKKSQISVSFESYSVNKGTKKGFCLFNVSHACLQKFVLIVLVCQEVLHREEWQQRVIRVLSEQT